MDNKVYFSENLRTLRRKYGISQSWLGKIVNVEPQTISKWERGINEPGFQVLLEISEYFKISLDDLVAKEIEGEDTIMKHLHNEAQKKSGDTPELFMFSRISVDESEAVGLFKRAYELDCSDSGTDTDAYIEMIHLYWDAFDQGLMDAGVNLLRVLASCTLVAKAKGDSNPFQLQSKMEHIISELKSIGHPAGEYYDALALIYGLMEGQENEDECLDEGILMMYDLANEGNEYATAWVASIEATDKE